MKLDIEGLAKQPLLRRQIVARTGKALSRLPAQPATVLVHFADVNGPKGGVDTRCGITVWLPGRRTVHVEELARSERQAFAGAIDALETRLRRDAERALDARRRPKKYYVARRLLETEPGAATPRGRSSTRRRRPPTVRS
jgi:ribosome-associated translation inhibitor RaiA